MLQELRRERRHPHRTWIDSGKQVQHRRIAGNDQRADLLRADSGFQQQLLDQGAKGPRDHRMLQASDHLGMRDAQLDSCQYVVTQADLGVQPRRRIHDFSGGQVDQHADDRRRADVHGHAESRRRVVGFGRPGQPGITDLLQHHGGQRQGTCPLLQFRRRSYGQVVVSLAGYGFANCLRQRFLSRPVARRHVASRQVDPLPQRIVGSRNVDAERGDDLRLVSQQRPAGDVDFDIPLRRQVVLTGTHAVRLPSGQQCGARAGVDQLAGQQVDQAAVAQAVLRATRVQGHAGLPQQRRQDHLRAAALGGNRLDLIRNADGQGCGWGHKYCDFQGLADAVPAREPLQTARKR